MARTLSRDGAGGKKPCSDDSDYSVLFAFTKQRRVRTGGRTDGVNVVATYG
jgi:hypothetical protein